MYFPADGLFLKIKGPLLLFSILKGLSKEKLNHDPNIKMKKLHIIYLLSSLVGLSSCSNTVTVETAENFEQVELPDSSVVYLNQNSKLIYDKRFSERRVKLVGEGFFSINEGKTPFIIETDKDEEVTVLGTEFCLIASVTGVVIEVEIGIVSLRIGSGIFKEVRRGQRLDFGRHDNGLHLGQAKHKHRSWIKVMDKNFAKSGKMLKHSPKHTGKNYSKGDKNKSKGNKSTFKGDGKQKSTGKEGSSKTKSKKASGGKDSDKGSSKSGKGGSDKKGKN